MYKEHNKYFNDENSSFKIHELCMYAIIQYKKYRKERNRE